MRPPLILCAVAVAIGMSTLAAKAGDATATRACGDICQALLALPPDPEAEIAPPRTFAVRSTKRRSRKVDYYFYVNEDCSQPDLVQLEVVSPPRAGLVAANTGPERALYPAANPRAACNNRLTLSSRLYYLPNGSRSQDDDFAIVAIYPDRSWEEVHYHVSRR